MSELTSLDSIIHKYKDLFTHTTNCTPLPIFVSSNFSHHKHAAKTPAPTEILAFDQPPSFTEPSPCALNIPQLLQRSASKQRIPPREQDGSNYIKYKETLALMMEENARNKKLHEELELCHRKLQQSEKVVKDLEHMRLTDKLEYGRKLEILSQNQGQTQGIPHKDSPSKVEVLEKQIWGQRKTEEELRKRLLMLEQENVRLATLSKQTVPNQGIDEMSFFKDDASRENEQLKQVIIELQDESNEAQKEICHLKEELFELNMQNRHYSERLTEMENKLESTIKSNKTLNRTAKTEGLGENELDETGAIQKKLKSLERDYEKLCSQMLTVDSFKKIAKRTTRYYNKKPN